MCICSLLVLFLPPFQRSPKGQSLVRECGRWLHNGGTMVLLYIILTGFSCHLTACFVTYGLYQILKCPNRRYPSIQSHDTLTVVYLDHQQLWNILNRLCLKAVKTLRVCESLCRILNSYKVYWDTNKCYVVLLTSLLSSLTLYKRQMTQEFQMFELLPRISKKVHWDMNTGLGLEKNITL